MWVEGGGGGEYIQPLVKSHDIYFLQAGDRVITDHMLREATRGNSKETMYPLK